MMMIVICARKAAEEKKLTKAAWEGLQSRYGSLLVVWAESDDVPALQIVFLVQLLNSASIFVTSFVVLDKVSRLSEQLICGDWRRHFRWRKS